MKIEHKIIALSVILGLLVWVIDAFLDSFFFYEGSFLDLLIFKISGFEIYIRLTWIMLFLAFGIIASRIVRKRVEAEEALHRAYDELEKRVQDRTAELTVANKELQAEIIERRRVEERLRLLSEAVDEAPDGVQIVDLDGRIVFSNKSVEAIYGFSPDEFKGKHVDEMNVDPELASSVILPAIRETGRWVGEIMVKHKDGYAFPIWLNASMVKDSKGQPIAIVGIIRDITERKRMEDALRESEEKFRSIVEQSGDGIVLVDERGNITDWNRAEEQIIGLKRAEVIGRPLWDIQFHIAPEERKTPENYERIKAGLLGLTRTGQSDWLNRLLETDIQRPDGTRRSIQVLVFPIKTNRGFKVSSITRDVTERKRAEEELRTRTEELARSNADLEQFAYVVSHDLQDPLRMVSGFTQLLERRYKDKLGTDADEFIAYIVDGARRMQGMIEDLLAYSRVGTRGKPFEPINLEDIFNQAVTNLKVAIEENKAQVTHDPLPTVTADASQMIQLFQNLMSNAIKFRKKGEPPHIHISARREKDEWVFSVQDNGIGISPEFKDRLFQIFQREHTAGEYPGTGIGLAVCRRIMERHGGQIWAESEPGKGSTFYFTIPVRSERQ